jgi:hypothetical protein
MPDPSPRSPADRRRIARVAADWGALTLGTLTTLVALILWHLVRRGRLLRQGLHPPRDVRLPEEISPQRPQRPQREKQREKQKEE